MLVENPTISSLKTSHPKIVRQPKLYYSWLIWSGHSHHSGKWKYKIYVPTKKSSWSQKSTLMTCNLMKYILPTYTSTINNTTSQHNPRTINTKSSITVKYVFKPLLCHLKWVKICFIALYHSDCSRYLNPIR